MLKNSAIGFLLIASLSAFGQVGGEATYQFLNLIASPRQAALGGKVFTNLDYDVSQALTNPATINADMDNQLAINYSSYLGGISYGTAAYGYTWDRRTLTFFGGISYINYGDFEGYDEQGNATGAFTGNEAALSFGHSRQIGYSNFYLGGTLKVITSKLEQYTSLGAALDAGLMYVDEDIEFQATLVVRNLGMQFTTYAGQNEPLPFEVALGLSQTLENVPLRWHVTFENLQKWPISVANPARVETDLEGNQTSEKVGFFGNVLRHTILGAEIFPAGGFNIRVGYNFRKGEELRIVDRRNFSGISAGIGLKLNKFRFSFSHVRYTSASNANFFGMQIDLR
ncbi:type IX secretion system protein PorQ [Bizionia sediminis]|uniref:Type IX secretion system protein PorQ n=1 Tax=Bizionia sediminis TaxID=1737064 RepID=A0ABW5KVG7_9FLAO